MNWTAHLEDLPVGWNAAVGPLTLSNDDLDRFIAMSAENFPVHRIDSTMTIGERRLLPGKLIQAVATARLRTLHGVPAIVRPRSLHLDYLRQLRTGDVFNVRAEVVAVEPVAPGEAAVHIRYQVFDGTGALASIALAIDVVKSRAAVGG